MIGIYKFTNKINNKSYIGQSVCIEKRYQQHLHSASKSKLPFHLALNKYGINNHKAYPYISINYPNPIR